MPRHSSSRSSRSRSVIRKRKHHKRSTSSSSSSANSDRRRSSHYRRRSRSNEQKKSSKRSSQKPVEQQATHYNFRDTTIAAIAKTDSNPIQKVFLKPQISFGSEEVKQFRAKHYIFVRSSHQNVPDPIAKFDEVSCFPRAVVEQIQRAGFKAPTPIQSQGWSIALSGHDLIGIAQTGSGKTLAFLLPALVHIQNQHHRHSSEPQCLILAPTRELTLQIYEQFQKFTQGSHLYAACLYGGQEKYIQKNQLRRGAQILIACPGRLIDLIDTGHTTLKSITFLILDEADRMLDMGFEPQIRKIVGQIRPDRQTMLFSATWPKEVQKLALDFCHEQPVHIQIGNVELTSNRQIKQSVIVLKSNEKHMSVGMFIFLLLWEFSYRKQKDQQGRHQINKPIILRLLQILRDIGHKKILIFCATKKGCDVLQKGLEREGIRCLSIHGDKKQNERDYVMNNFRTGRATTLIATDVASRGLDIKDIEYVINFDMPKVIEDYVHRIGRTGRAGALGISISFFASDEDHRMAKELGEILKESNTEIPPELRQLMETSRHGGGSNSYNPYRRWNNNGQQSGGYNNNHRENNNSSGYNNNHHGGYNNNNTNGYSGNNYNNGSSSYNHANSSNYPSSNQAHYLRSQPTVQPQQVWPSTTTTSYPIAAQVLPTAQSSWAYQPPAVPTTSSWENKGIYEMNQYQQQKYE